MSAGWMTVLTMAILAVVAAGAFFFDWVYDAVEFTLMLVLGLLLVGAVALVVHTIWTAILS